MIKFWVHASERNLKRFADGELPPKNRERVAAHLARCVECRGYIAFARELRDRVAALDRAAAAPGLLDRINARLAAGDTVILPTADPRPAPLAWRVPAAIAACLLALGAVWIAWPTPRLSAGASEGLLTFSPTRPRAGATVQIAYRASALLAGRERLVLRARYRTPRDESYNRGMRQIMVGTLIRVDEERYRGTVRLPDSVVYAVFAVEDSGGRHVDSNGRRLWELLVHDSLGRPTFDALSQREHDLMGRNWELGYETARRVAALYPERVEGWSSLLFYERNVLGESYLDSALAGHRARLQAFHKRLASRTTLSDNVPGEMFWYAGAVGDSALTSYWQRRLESEAPRSPFAAQNRALAIVARMRTDKDSARAIVDMDRLWDEVGPAHGNVVNVGWSVARVVGDSAGLVRWANHYLDMNRGDSAWIATAFSRYPALRNEGMRLLRQELHALDIPNDARRSLERTVEEQRAADAANARSLLAALGDALVASGHTAAGLDTLDLAVREGWEVALFRNVARTRLASGDTAGALTLLGFVAADPATESWTVDSTRRFIGSAVDTAAWRRAVESGRAEMRGRVLDRATRRPLPASVRLGGTGGRLVRFDSLAQGRVTFVAFWSRHCQPSLEELPAVQRMAARLSHAGIGVVTITDERPSQDLQRFLAAKGLSFPVYTDGWRDASRAFHQWGTPSYYVVDASGQVRFTYRALDQTLADIAALQ